MINKLWLETLLFTVYQWPVHLLFLASLGFHCLFLLFYQIYQPVEVENVQAVKETKDNGSKEYEAAAKRLDNARLVCPLSLKFSIILRCFMVSNIQCVYAICFSSLYLIRMWLICHDLQCNISNSYANAMSLKQLYALCFVVGLNCQWQNSLYQSSSCNQIKRSMILRPKKKKP